MSIRRVVSVRATAPVCPRVKANSVKGKLDLTSSTCLSSCSAPHAQCRHTLEAFVAEQMTQASKLVQNGRKLCILLHLEELLKFVESAIGGHSWDVSSSTDDASAFGMEIA